MNRTLIDKKGYKKEEVNSYISELTTSYEQRLAEQLNRIYELRDSNTELSKKLKQYEEKDKTISEALLAAVDKAKEIENLARLKYVKEMERLQVFHEKWVRYFAEIKKRYPLDNMLESADEFLKEIDNIITSELTHNLARKDKVSAGRASDLGSAIEISVGDKLFKESSDAHLTAQTNPQTNPQSNTQSPQSPISTYKQEQKRLSKGEEILKGALSDAVSPPPVQRYEKLLDTYKRAVALNPQDIGRADTEAGAQVGAQVGGYSNSVNNTSGIGGIGGASGGTKSRWGESESGFDIVEALRPTQSLEEIIRDLGLLDEEK